MAEIPTRSGPTALAATTTTIKTAGAADTWVILRSILVTNTHTASVKVTVGVGTTNTDAAAKRLVSQMPLGVGETLEVLAPGFVPLAGGATPDLLYALCDVAAGATITLGTVEGP
ncbi:MAG: hypothetical protein ACR2HR_03185 [Euzebya sp.]